jgi:membrane protease YdiL (CAAX protease family)
MARKNDVKRSAVTICVVLLMDITARFLPEMASPLATTLFLRALQLMIMAFLLRKQFTQGSLGSLAPDTLKAALIRGSLWSMGFGVVVGSGALLLAFIDIPPLPLVKMRLPQDPATLILFFITGGLVAPMAEEFLFRGIIYRLLRPMGVVPAMAISTLLFASAHAMQGVVPLTQLVGGVLFAAAFEKEGHLAVPVVIHGVGNTALFTLSLI